MILPSKKAYADTVFGSLWVKIPINVCFVLTD